MWLRRGGFVVALALVGTAARSSAQQPAAVRAAAGIMDSMLDAVRRQDPAKMIRSYVDSGVVFSSHGLFVTSHQQLASMYQQWDSTTVQGTYAEWSDRRFEVLGPDAILALARIRLAPGNRAGAPTDTMSGTWTGVFVRRRGRWALLHEHESFRSARSAARQ